MHNSVSLGDNELKLFPAKSYNVINTDGSENISSEKTQLGFRSKPFLFVAPGPDQITCIFD